jgi:hypothetical protein
MNVWDVSARSAAHRRRETFPSGGRSLAAGEEVQDILWYTAAGAVWRGGHSEAVEANSQQQDVVEGGEGDIHGGGDGAHSYV